MSWGESFKKVKIFFGGVFGAWEELLMEVIVGGWEGWFGLERYR
jgi:hypothetical protein